MCAPIAATTEMAADLSARAGGICEFCASSDGLGPAIMPPGVDLLLCSACREAEGSDPHWRCLEGAAWSETPEVQAAAALKLDTLAEPWAAEAREAMVLSDAAAALLETAPATLEHRDSNGALLAQGDTVVLIKDLPVKGAGFTAKRGTAVRGISLVPDNPAHIEGRVEGQRIVILTEFVKKR
ncbi:MAG: PhnA domain-containing protein [Paracoccus sp. (in: a-proteobacteria)]|nr:PhnA domain-containing protein [Paracoccus sp. (in: a-proteobacteria)]